MFLGVPGRSKVLQLVQTEEVRKENVSKKRLWFWVSSPRERVRALALGGFEHFFFPFFFAVVICRSPSLSELLNVVIFFKFPCE